jgi:hypothetical protein
MYIVDDIVRRAEHRVGWEVGSAVENVVWTVGIVLFLTVCGAISCGVVAWKIMVP